MTDPMHALPLEVMLLVFSKLSSADLLLARGVSRAWQELLGEDLLWERFSFDGVPEHQRTLALARSFARLSGTRLRELNLTNMAFRTLGGTFTKALVQDLVPCSNLQVLELSCLPLRFGDSENLLACVTLKAHSLRRVCVVGCRLLIEGTAGQEIYQLEGEDTAVPEGDTWSSADYDNWQEIDNSHLFPGPYVQALLNAAPGSVLQTDAAVRFEYGGLTLFENARVEFHKLHFAGEEYDEELGLGLWLRGDETLDYGGERQDNNIVDFLRLLRAQPSLSTLIMVDVRAGAPALGLVADLRTLTSLILQDCDVNSACLPHLTRMLESGLRVLDLTSTDLDEDVNVDDQMFFGAPRHQVAAFASAILNSTTIRELRLYGMDVFGDGNDGLALLRAATGHPSLETLDLRRWNIQENTAAWPVALREDVREALAALAAHPQSKLKTIRHGFDMPPLAL